MQNMLQHHVHTVAMPKRTRSFSNNLPVRPVADIPRGAASSLTLPQAMQRAVAGYQKGAWAEAERLCRLILDAQADYFDALLLLGAIAAQTRRLQEAVELLSRAVRVNPKSAEAYSNRGNALADLRQYEAALESFERAIALRPDCPDFYVNHGNALSDLERYEAALESFDRAIALKPDYAEAYSNRGGALRGLKEHNAALESYARAIALKPGYAEAFYNRGNTLRDLRRHEEALENYEWAIEHGVDYALAHWNLALCHLQLGDFARGWKEFEWRWKTAPFVQYQRNFAQPLWLGAQPLAGKTILLHSEQGLGDTLQFSRYAGLVAALGARVLLEVQPPLLRLHAGRHADVLVLPMGAPLPAFDYHCPLMSLPLAFKTDLQNIPASTPYIRSDAACLAHWRNKLGIQTKPRVGLVWSGNAKHTNDRNRSIALAELLSLLSDRADWISLQKEVRVTDAELLATSTGVRHFGEQLADFTDTAALVDLMDVIVTVDTSVAHLAGAMGKTVWILLPFNPDWRWLLNGENSMWYPTARLFRQSAIGDWPGVIRRVTAELERHFGM